MNQSLEIYFHIFCNYDEKDWFELLLLTEFIYNNAIQESIKMSPFFANYSFHLCFLAESHPMSLFPSLFAPSAEQFASYLHEIHEHLI